MSDLEMEPELRAYLNAKSHVLLTYPSAYALSVDDGFVIAGAGQLLDSQVTEVGAWMEYAQWLRDWPRRRAEMEATAASLHVLAFDRDTQTELAKQMARHWVVAHYLRSGQLPNNATFYAYPNNTGFGWGNGENGPMHGKRVVLRLTIEDEAKL